MVIQDWASVVVSSLQNLWVGAVAALGDIIGALIVLIIGLIIASGVSMLVARVLDLIKLDKALMKLGLQQYFERAGLKINSGKFFGKIVYWFLTIVFLLAAADILKFYSLSDFLKQVLLYIPNVIVAALIMLAAVVVGNFLRHLVRASVKGAGLHASGFLASLSWWAIVIFGFFAALTQLGVAVGLIQSIVTGLVAMFALAGGIAFGLGGKDYAGELLRRFKDRVEM